MFDGHLFVHHGRVAFQPVEARRDSVLVREDHLRETLVCSVEGDEALVASYDVFLEELAEALQILLRG